MRKTERKKFEAKLQELREGFLRKYNDAARDSAGEDDGIRDYIDFATQSYTKEFLLSLGNLERRRLQQVEAALERVRTTAYGLCLSCEEEIGSKRLKAAPWVELCIRCQEEQERGSARTGRTFNILEEEPDLTTDD
jgi:DnaK suppressor protein